MDDPGFVSGSQPFGNLKRDLDDAVERNTPAIHFCAQ